MGQDFGRVSGPLLSDNLLRNGDNLAFETNLLYIDVITGRIGIKTETAVRTLTINNAISTTNLIVDTQHDIANFTILENKIQNPLGAIYFQPNQTVNPTVKMVENRTQNLSFTNQLIKNFITDSNIEITPNGSGQVKFYTNTVNVNGNLHATGNITADGILTFGDSNLDNVTFDADITSNIVPDINNTHDLGIPSQRWKTLYSTNIISKNVVTPSYTVNNIDLLLTQGKTYYVSTTGNDTLSSGSYSYIGEYDNNRIYNIGDVVSSNGVYYKRISDSLHSGYQPSDLTRWLITNITYNQGTHPHSPFRTLKHALSLAQAGDEVVIFPGIYNESFPLIVPQGVDVKGSSSGTVVINPTISTQSNDAFLLSGDTSVSFLTIRNFFFDQVNNTGYAFKLNNNFNIITKSPYIYNVTVETAGSVKTSSDIYGFNSGDAGGGFYIDGSVKSSTYYNIPSILVFNVTLKTPNQHAILATNGVRVELINVYTYYAKYGIHLTPGNTGCTNLKKYINLVVPNNILLKTTTAESFFRCVANVWESSLLGIGTLLINSSQFPVNTTITNIQGPFTDYGIKYYIIYTSSPPLVDLEPETRILAYDPNLIQYGAELRSINSSNNYGTYGAVADGNECVGYLTNHIFNYVGTNGSSIEDLHDVIQANEVVAINGGEIIYESIDQTGNFRLGDIFYVNQESGDVIFNANSINLYSDGGIIFESGTGIVSVTPTSIQSSNIRIYDNTIQSLTGPVNLLAASNKTTLNTNVYVTGMVSVTDNANIKGNVFLGNDPYDLVAIFPNLTQTIKPDLTNTFTLGHKDLDPKVWNTLFLKTLNVDNVIQITNNTISTLSSSDDIKLIASGTGKIHVSSTDVKINNNLTVNNQLTVNGLTTLKNTFITGNILQSGDINQTGDLGITGTFANNNIILTGLQSYFKVPNINIQNNIISATNTNGDISFVANGTGGVVLDDKIKISDTTISNRWNNATTDLQKSIIITTTGSSNVIINTNKFLKIPVNANDILTSNGEIKQNSSTTLYEAYNNGVFNSFTSLYSSDRKTKVTPELTYGENDNTLRFYTNNQLRTTIDSYKLYSNSITVDSIHFSNNTINNINSSNDLEFHPTGTGNTNLNGILINNQSTITNNTTGSLVLASTGSGYIKFSGTFGIVIPYGPPSSRRITPELGEIRINSNTDVMEVYNGTIWINANGESDAATLADIVEITEFWSLIMG